MHDLDLFVSCNAGITCMYASSHCNPDDSTQRYLHKHNAQQSDNNFSTVKASAVAGADAAIHAEVPSGPSVELTAKMPSKTAGKLADGKTRQSVAKHIAGGSAVVGLHYITLGCKC